MAAKKNYNLNTPVSPATSEALALVKSGKKLPVGYVSKMEDANLSEILMGFEDKSLPTIIDARKLNNGDIVFGEFDGTFGKYQKDKTNTLFININILRPTAEGLRPVGIRGALPVGTVLQRALGADGIEGKDLNGIEAKIIANGYTKGTQIAQKYLGIGKERKGQNAPHLWDIKIKAPGGEPTRTTSTKK